MTFKQINREATVDDQTSILKIRGKEIGFVYYRSGYQSVHYQLDGTKEGQGDMDEDKWGARRLLELSMPIKCPSVDVHLSGFKKFQQIFCIPEVLKEIASDEKLADEVQHLFKGIYSLEEIGKGNSEVDAIIEKAVQNPHDFVLKPQKEGGGNNFFDEELKALLQDKTKYNVLSTYILMNRIYPPTIHSWMLR